MVNRLVSRWAHLCNSHWPSLHSLPSWLFLAENTSLCNHTLCIPSKPFLAEKLSDFNDLYPFSLRIYGTNRVSIRHVVNRLVSRWAHLCNSHWPSLHSLPSWLFLAENTSLCNHTLCIPSKPFLAEKLSDFNDLYPFSLRIYDTNRVSIRHVVNRLLLPTVGYVLQTIRIQGREKQGSHGKWNRQWLIRIQSQRKPNAAVQLWFQLLHLVANPEGTLHQRAD